MKLLLSHVRSIFPRLVERAVGGETVRIKWDGRDANEESQKGLKSFRTVPMLVV